MMAQYGNLPPRTGSAPGEQTTPQVTGVVPGVGSPAGGPMQMPANFYPGTEYGYQQVHAQYSGYVPPYMQQGVMAGHQVAGSANAYEKMGQGPAGSPSVSPNLGPAHTPAYAMQYGGYPGNYPGNYSPYYSGVSMVQQQQQQQAKPPPKAEKKILQITTPDGKSITDELQKKQKEEVAKSKTAPAAAATVASRERKLSTSTPPPVPAPTPEPASVAVSSASTTTAEAPKKNVLLDAVVSKLTQENDDKKQQQERLRKEADAKAKMEETERKREELRRKHEEEDRQKRELEAKKKADELEAKKEQMRAAEEARKRAEETKKSSAFPSGGGSAFGNRAGGTSNVSGSKGSAPPSEPVAAARGSTSGGKITYTLDQLLALKSQFTDKPADLQSISFDIVQVSRNTSQRGGFSRQQGNYGSSRNMGNAGGNWQNRGKDQQRRPGGLVVQPIQVSENAWKRKAPADDHELTIKKVKGILNKLTIENFEKLSKQMTDVRMSSVEMLKETMAVIFDKALTEPKFGELYADLCKVIVDTNAKQTWDFVSIEEKDGQFFWTTSSDESLDDKKRLMGPHASFEEAKDSSKKATEFKRILLNKCQEEFEKDSQIADAEKKMAEFKKALNIEINGANNPAKVSELKVELQEATYAAVKIKRKVLGNIQFIGELFKKKILTEKVMHSCISKILLSDEPEDPLPIPEEDDLECLCKLLTTIGSALDALQHEKTRILVTRYFDRLKKLSRAKELPARQKFLIMDLIELRGNKWQARREELKAKKITDVHKDAKREEQDKARATRAAAGNRGNMSRGGNQRQNQNQNRGGYRNNYSPTNYGSGNRNQQNTPMMGSIAMQSKMGQGYKVVGGNRPASKPTSTGGGAASGSSLRSGGSALGGRPGGMGASPAGGSMRPGGGLRPGGTGMGSLLAQQGSRTSRLGPASGGRATNSPTQQDRAPVNKEPVDMHKLDTSIQNTLAEYVALQMTDEMIENFKELATKVDSQVLRKAIIKKACFLIVEKKDEERRHVPDALVILAQNKKLSQQDFVQVLTSQLEFLGDEMMDSPLAGTHYAMLMSRLIGDGVITLGDLKEIMSKLIAETPHIAPKVLSLILAKLKSEHPETLKKQASSLPIKAVLGVNVTDEKVADFLKTHELADIFK